MGTNYYLRKNVCQHCNRGDADLHIGKSSAGWCFGLHVIPDMDINTLKDWQRKFEEPNSKIFDEYGNEVSVELMMEVITDRRTWNTEVFSDEFLKRNGAKVGPNRLLRHKVDDTFCIGNGEGTWDYMQGEFS